MNEGQNFKKSKKSKIDFKSKIDIIFAFSILNLVYMHIFVVLE